MNTVLNPLFTTFFLRCVFSLILFLIFAADKLNLSSIQTSLIVHVIGIVFAAVYE